MQRASALLCIGLAVCGLVQLPTALSSQSFGLSYGDSGNAAVYVQAISPASGPKQGGTTVTVTGSNFRYDPRAQCKFTRRNPCTAQMQTKYSAATYVSPTEATCMTPEWEEVACTTAAKTQITGMLVGATGSPYLRTNDANTNKEIGVGDTLEISVATHGTETITQYIEVAAVSACTGVGCWCANNWQTDVLTPTLTYDGQGRPAWDASFMGWDKGYPEIETSYNPASQCSMYRYDYLSGGAANPNVPIDVSRVETGAQCTPSCSSGSFAPGSKLTLAESIYRPDGDAQVTFGESTRVYGYRATVRACTSCKCKGGCETTLSYSNDGFEWSGGGYDGKVWTGTGGLFSFKDIIPTVHYLSLGLTGYRDSTRIFGPASGGTSVTVKGKNFQQSSNLACYFEQVDAKVKATYISDTEITCTSPPFWARQYDSTGTQYSNTAGSATTPNTKVKVTNNGMITEGSSGADSTSRNPYLSHDGSYAYIIAPDKANQNQGEASGNPFRSTCLEGKYPNELNKPCYEALTNPASSPPAISIGNDVIFRYATCYDAKPAEAIPSMNLYPSPVSNLGLKKVNSTTTLGQKISFAATNWVDGTTDFNHEQIESNGAIIQNPNNVEGPLAMVSLHLEKASTVEAQIEVSVRAGGLEADSLSYLMAKEVIKVSGIILQAQNDYEYNVHFQNPPYLLPGQDYYLQLKWVAGASDVEWKSATGSGGYVNTAASDMGYQFKLKGYACDGCRTKMAFDPRTHSQSDIQFGLYNNLTESGQSTYTTNYYTQSQMMRDASTPRSMVTQEVRPSETGTLNKIYLKLKTNPITRLNGDGTNAHQTDDQAYVTMWITQHGKYGENVCKSVRGSQVAALCDVNGDSVFDEMCVVGAVCNPENSIYNGGCGDGGECSLATTFAGTFRPDSGQTSVAPCGPSVNCADTQTLQPDTYKTLKNIDGWVQFELNTPIAVEKHTTYYVNVAVQGNIDVSKPVTWYNGVGYGDGCSTADNGGTALPAHAPSGQETPSCDLRSAYRRDPETFVWRRIENRVMAIKFTRCVSSTAQTLGFVTTGERTGCCSARSSPQGGLKGATVTVTGRNLFPSEHLSCVWANPDGSNVIQPAVSVDYSYTVATCEAPPLNPYSATDCSDPTNCNGVTLTMTNDANTVGPQYFAPKWYDTQNWNNAQLGYNPMLYLFSDIFISPTGSDTVGDGTQARPFQTIQRGLDAANEHDQIILFCGTYTGTGNRGLRHHGKKIQLRSIDSVDVLATTAADSRALLMSGQVDIRVMNEGSDTCGIDTVLDCEHSSDGFILNNNKDSDSPFAGHIDTEGIVIRNCESLRIYDI